MHEKTITEVIPQELHFLQKFDRARQAIVEIVDMPDRKLNSLLTRLHRHNGKLARREGEFVELTNEEVTEIEEAYRTAFTE